MIIWATVFCVFLSVFFLVLFLVSRISSIPQYLRRTSIKHSDVLDLPFGKLIAVTSSFFTGKFWHSVITEKEDRLLRAGSPGGKLSGEQFFAILILSSAGMWLFNFLILISIEDLNFLTIIIPTMTACGTYVVGNMWLSSLIEDREKYLSRDFPYFIDMCVMVMGAGSTFQQAIKIYLRENPDGVLSEELKNVSSEIDYGKSLIEALSNMESRIDSVGVKNSLKAFIQGLDMGTSINESLVEQADAMRFMRSQIAERVAEEMKIRMQGPAMLLLISVLVLILGPAAVNLKDSGMF